MGLAVVVVLLVVVAAFVVGLGRQWDRFGQQVAPPDDLRRADNGYEFPSGDPTGGFIGNS